MLRVSLLSENEMFPHRMWVSEKFWKEIEQRFSALNCVLDSSQAYLFQVKSTA
jgi:hypothetical protein